ncbi:C-X-C chemokine receptor type 3.3 isoform X1 [Danio rerio]|uniref:C-X-C chemokine receptor type 3.3 isoform X1 n=2 Tax=Danio rerio TaxID=7955 RepID=A0A8M2BKS4_DANRE
MAAPSNMEVELHGLFEKNNSFDYDNYENKELDCQSKAVSDALGVFIPLLYSLGILLGLLGHGLVLAVLWHKWLNCSVMDIFIFHLSLIDSLLLLTMPLWAVDAVKGWIMGSGLCKLAGVLFKMNFYCSMLMLAFISVDCYLSIVHGVQKLSRKKPMVVHGCCLIIWLVCLLLSIPEWIFLKSISDSTDQVKDECIYFYPDDSWHRSSRFPHHVIFGVGTLVLLFCCTSIMLKLQRESMCQQKKIGRKTAIIAVLVLVFLICWTPYSIAFIVNTGARPVHIDPLTGESECEWRQWTASKITAIFGLLHCTINPVIYFCFSKEFRRRSQAVIKFNACESNNNDGSLWDSTADNVNTTVQEEQGPLQQVNELKPKVQTQQEDT